MVVFGGDGELTKTNFSTVVFVGGGGGGVDKN